MSQIHPADPADEKLIRSFARHEGAGAPGFVTNFLGAKTRLAYFAGIDHLSGVVEDYPCPNNFHATALEWAGVLRAVVEAEHGKFTAVELGAGWGPWLVSAALAARQKGIAQVRLLGVEGSVKHAEFMHEHFRDNGVDPGQHNLLHGVVGTYDGVAHFPVIPDSAANWGAGATYRTRLSVAPQPQRGWARRWGRPVMRLLRGMKARMLRRPRAADSAGTEKVPCFSLPTLLESYDRVDVIHIDIQGAEYDVVAGARRVLLAKAKRLVIGTHGRLIEERLMDELASQGWRLESEEACYFGQAEDHMYLWGDGCQIWRNRRMDAGVTRQQAKAA
jgi:FkbM family methyltransferase